MLHLVADLPLANLIVGRMAVGDDVVLQGGWIWAAFAGHQDNLIVQQLLSRGCNVYALKDQLSMNGIADSQLLLGVDAIDYTQLVELSVKNTVIHNWC
jgi:tRNA 2-thiouridine synthesizing protein B